MKPSFLLACLSCAWAFCSGAYAADYLAPNAIGLYGGELAVVNNEGRNLLLVQPGSGDVTASIPLPDKPNGLLLDGDTAYISMGGPLGTVAVADLKSKKITRLLEVGHTPQTPVKRGKLLYVPNRFNNNIFVMDLESGKQKAVIPARREVSSIAVSEDGKTLWAANLLPAGPSDGDFTAAELTRWQEGKTTHYPLDNGAQSVRGLALSPDGRHLVLSHLLSRYQVPTTQLDRGWMNTNAITIVDTQNPESRDCILLDDVDSGAANPWAVAFTPNGKKLIVSHAGSHELSIIDFPALLEKIKSGKARNAHLNKLSFLSGLRTRVKLPLNGPRCLATDGSTVYAAGYFSDDIAALPLTGAPLPRRIPLVQEANQPLERLGERYFNDASLCFQSWQSCVSCHPDARVDALNWDLLNDGQGNPKNTRTMFLAHRTSPVMTLGIRKDAETAVRAGFHHIQFIDPAPEHTEAVDAYLKNMKMVSSPFLDYGKLSKPQEKGDCIQCHAPELKRGSLTKSAQRGKKLFKSQGCIECHPHPWFTTKQLCDTGTLKGLDEGKKVVVPSLAEIWRTAPYMHDGRTTSLKEVITLHNKDDKRGKTSTLTPRELEDLVNYLKSL